MATRIFSVTAEMVKRILKTTLGDADIEEVAQKKESWVSQRTGYTVAPAGAELLDVLQHMVILETAIEVKTRDPHSEAAGDYRQEHYPQLTWRGELQELYERFPFHVTKATEYQTEDTKKAWNE